MDVVKDTKFCVTDWSALDHKCWPSVVACAKQAGPIEWAWPKRVTPLSIKCLIKSAETYELPGRSVTVDRNSFLIINEGTEYSSRIVSLSDVETASVFLSSRICAEVFANLNLSHELVLDRDLEAAPAPIRFVERLYPRDERILPLLFKIHKMANSQAEEGELTELLYSLAEELFRLNDNVSEEINQLKFSRAATREEIYKRLHICRDFLVSNMHKNIELADLAGAAGFSPHHLLRVFREVFGKTPHQYLTELRLERARDMILNQEVLISDVCADVGFESLTSFSALYKKHYKYSPQQHRRSNLL